MNGKRSIFFGVGMLIAAIVLLVGYVNVVTPSGIAHPRLEHAHLRLQVVADGADVHFGDKKFQNYYKAVCTDDLSEQPIHFHDFKDQFVHLHWKGMTGGLILKNYGWNLVGGTDDTLGYRSDRLPLLNRVPTYGDVLPHLPADDMLWVYTGDQNSYTERSVKDFLYQDIETFLGKKSNVSSTAAPDALTSLLFARASAHGGAKDGDEHTQAELSEINNLLGNIVVFAQKDRPTDQQVKDKFNHLEPLSASTCGG